MAEKRKIKMFRCQYDPNIPPAPRQAFTMGTGPGQTPGEAELSALGVVLRMTGGTAKGREFLIPFTNILFIEFDSETARKLYDKNAPQIPEKTPAT